MDEYKRNEQMCFWMARRDVTQKECVFPHNIYKDNMNCLGHLNGA